VSGTPELTITVPCATCGGTGTVTEQALMRVSATGAVIMGTGYRKCDCDGTGVTRTPVTCASCRYWTQGTTEDGDKDYHGDCFIWGINTRLDFGCKAWTAKEATDGNG